MLFSQSWMLWTARIQRDSRQQEISNLQTKLTNYGILATLRSQSVARSHMGDSRLLHSESTYFLQILHARVDIFSEPHSHMVHALTSWAFSVRFDPLVDSLDFVSFWLKQPKFALFTVCYYWLYRVFALSVTSYAKTHFIFQHTGSTTIENECIWHPKKSGPVRRAHKLSTQTLVPSRLCDPTALWVRLFGQRLWIRYPKWNPYFGLGNWVLSNPQRNRGFRWTADNVEME